jgi:hypothetical protein
MAERFKWKPLNTHVLVVAVIDDEYNNFAAYIGAVPGQNHDNEYQAIARSGSKLVESIARAIFPSLSGIEYRD